LCFLHSAHANLTINMQLHTLQSTLLATAARVKEQRAMTEVRGMCNV
jgi:hypothetical protein